jgi:S-adenosylmethionine:tRNA ribosyltransferase-isomerase
MTIENYDYELPSELIAQHPLPEREKARLMLVDRRAAAIGHHRIHDLPRLLSTGDCLVLNDTRVLPARLVGRRTRTGGRWEGLFLAERDGVWRLLSKTRGKIIPGETVTLCDRRGKEGVRLAMLAQLGEGAWAARPQSDESHLGILERYGRVPLPQYIRHGEMEESDGKDYQTVFAANPGAVAAPTAGLHFTTSLLGELIDRGIRPFKLTLHVGIGTFRPIATERLEDHVMHREWGRLDEHVAGELAERRRAGARIVAVGTTSMRVLETAAAGGELAAWEGETDLFIRPPFRFRAVDALLTNFHLPRSTLLVLVKTFGGDALIERAYREAIRERYRFYSYGDAMLIL